MYKKEIRGNAKVPRVVVSKSNSTVSCQLVNDEAQREKILAFFSSREIRKKNCNVDIARKVGEKMGEKIATLGIRRIVFDRSHYIFHGKIKAVAEGISSKNITI